MTLDEEVARLRAEGVSASDRIWVAHYFSHFHSNWIQRDNLCAALSYSGFGVGGGEIGIAEELSGDGFWHHWAFTVTTASKARLAELDARAARLASVYGAVFDESWVMRNAEGRLRPIGA